MIWIMLLLVYAPLTWTIPLKWPAFVTFHNGTTAVNPVVTMMVTVGTEHDLATDTIYQYGPDQIETLTVPQEAGNGAPQTQMITASATETVTDTVTMYTPAVVFRAVERTTTVTSTYSTMTTISEGFKVLGDHSSSSGPPRRSRKETN
jgi:hypothetical protein